MKLRVENVNWSEGWPEKPDVTVEIENSHEWLLLKWHVRGEQLRAVTTEDQGLVWEDSCVEFFCQVPGEEHYMNFECNCIGAMVASRRKGRAEDVQPLSPEQMARIERKCTYPREAFEERDGMYEWTVEERIPLDLIFQKPMTNEQFPLTLRANFYKCADKTKRPHFVSWRPIDLPNPDFHCPQFFGEITLY